MNSPMRRLPSELLMVLSFVTLAPWATYAPHGRGSLRNSVAAHAATLDKGTGGGARGYLSSRHHEGGARFALTGMTWKARGSMHQVSR